MQFSRQCKHLIFLSVLFCTCTGSIVRDNLFAGDCSLVFYVLILIILLDSYNEISVKNSSFTKVVGVQPIYLLKINLGALLNFQNSFFPGRD